MSAYKIIKISFKSLPSLLTALKEMGYTGEQLELVTNHKVNSLTLFGYHNDPRPEKAVVRILRSMLATSATMLVLCGTARRTRLL